jgi:hypothetical protein
MSMSNMNDRQKTITAVVAGTAAIILSYFVYKKVTEVPQNEHS